MSKTLMKIEFQSAIGGSDHHDSVGQSVDRRRVSSQLSVVRHRWSLLSAPMASSSRHTPPGRLRRALRPPSAPHSRPPLLTRTPPLLGELPRPHHHVPIRATLSRAPPGCPLPRCSLRCPSRAPVSPHCSLRRELHLAGVRRDHRRRGQTSLVHL